MLRWPVSSLGATLDLEAARYRLLVLGVDPAGLDATLDWHTRPSCLAAGRCSAGGGLSRGDPLEIAGEEGERFGLRDLLSVLNLLRHHLLLCLPADAKARVCWRGVARTSVSLWLAAIAPALTWV